MFACITAAPNSTDRPRLCCIVACSATQNGCLRRGIEMYVHETDEPMRKERLLHERTQLINHLGHGSWKTRVKSWTYGNARPGWTSTSGSHKSFGVGPLLSYFPYLQHVFPTLPEVLV